MELNRPERARGFRAPGPDEVASGSEPDPLEPDPRPTGTDGIEALEAGRPPSRWAARAASRRWFLGVWLVLVVAVVVIALLAFRLGTSSGAASSRATPTPSPAPATSATPLATTDLYTRVVPSVVVITTSKGSLGSGTVVTDTGTILTANHVISGGGSISVLFADGTRSSATVASRSLGTDTATLVPAKLPETVVAATLGGGIAVGADVVAIGNPLGLRDSTSTGVVSGLDRSNRTTAGTITGLIQFDAAVNPGSSGGPLLDDQGDVVGVVLSIADPGHDDAFAGIGFAVPIGAAVNGGGTGPGQGGGPQL